MGGEMTKVITLDGELINIGAWDYQLNVEEVVGNPYTGEGDPPGDWDFQIIIEEVIRNPMPDGAKEEDLEIIESAKGRLLLATDWERLREDAYPPIKDQLDAAWKGGDDAEKMRALVQSVKDKYPKPD